MTEATAAARATILSPTYVFNVLVYTYCEVMGISNHIAKAPTDTPTPPPHPHTHRNFPSSSMISNCPGFLKFTRPEANGPDMLFVLFRQTLSQFIAFICGCLLGGVYVPCIYCMPGGVILGDSGLLLCACSMCDANCSSAVTPHCLCWDTESSFLARLEGKTQRWAGVEPGLNLGPHCAKH